MYPPYVDTVTHCPECGVKNEVQGYGTQLEVVCDACGHVFEYPEPPEEFTSDE
jgi:rubredoxin